MNNQIIVHLDMDCFFCACEEKKDPSLKNKPVIVGGTGIRGVVSTSNYIARKYNVFSATPLSKARALCPQGIFLPTDMKFYKNESQKIMSVLRSITPLIEQVSIDEAYLDVTDFSKQFDSLERMGLFIQKKILKHTKLNCSIGISNSRYVSKIASDYKKPQGITVVKDAKNFLDNLDIKKIPGIGKVSKQKYYANKIKTIGDLAKKNTVFLFDTFGKSAIKFQKIAQGLDNTGLKKKEKSKSISRENTYQSDIENNLEKRIEKLTKEVFHDLQKINFKTVSIKIRYSDFRTITRDYTLKNYTNSYDKIKNISLKLFKETYNENEKIRLLGVKLSNLNYNFNNQMQLAAFC